MASPQSSQVNPPATLPGDFFDKQGSTPPETLPANFDFGGKSVQPPATGGTVSAAPDFLSTQPETPNIVGFGTASHNQGVDPGYIKPFLHSMLPEGVRHPLAAADQASSDFEAHPIRSIVEDDPAIQAARGIFGVIKRSGGELLQAGKSLVHGNPAEAVEHGVNAIPVVGPAMMSAAESAPDAGPGESYGRHLGRILSDPTTMGTLTGAAAAAAPAVVGGVDAAMGEPMEFGRIPTRGHATNVFKSIEKTAGNTPVPIYNTAPALKKFYHDVNYGDLDNGVISTLRDRVTEPQPIAYPDARRLYKNVNRVTAKPRWNPFSTEDPRAPDFRGAAGNVRQALDSDLQSTAESIGRGPDYVNAKNEYRRASNLRTGAKILGGAGAGLALQQTGIPGKIASKIIGTAR